MAAPARAADRVLVLYDSSGDYGWLGQLYVQHMKNLLSHFNVTVISKPVEQYAAGDLKRNKTTIYLGVVYDNPLPASFLKDFMASTKTFCWLGYNLWQPAWAAAYSAAFTQKFGINFLSLDYSPWAEVRYRGTALTRETASEIGRLQIVDPTKAEVVATCHTAEDEAPYITRAGNLWYVADNPMSYVTMTDRYLAFADVLHDILGINHPESHRAFVRIEDVTPMSDPGQLQAIADYLVSENVPFGVCVVPQYEDPLGVYNGGVPETLKLKKSVEVANALHYMVDRGGQIVLHGFTHQYDSVANPYSGVSAEDYEFFRVSLDDAGNIVLQGPVPGDSAAWARQRVNKGKNLLNQVGLTPVAWVTPHYLASVTDYKQFAKLFPISIDRGVYFATAADGTQYALEQMAPYVFQKDVYGVKRLPETLSYVDPWGFPPQPPALPATLLERAQKNKVVRDGWASCYFHWYLDINYLKELVSGLKAQGYEFVAISNTLQ